MIDGVLFGNNVTVASNLVDIEDERDNWIISRVSAKIIKKDGVKI